MSPRILFICLGNICRSPAAEGVTRALAARAGLALSLDSAGTGPWHLGEPPCPGMVRTARARGVDLSGLRARQMTRADYDTFDLMIGMDAGNLATIARARPTGSPVDIRLFTDYAPETGATEVPDAYYTEDYAGAFALIEACAAGLVADLAKP